MISSVVDRPLSASRCHELLLRLTAIAFAIDSDGIVVAWNKSAERWLGLPAGQVLGKALSDIHVPWSDAGVKAAMLAALSGTATVRLEEVTYARPDGRHGLLGFTASPVVDDARNESFVFVLGRDITEHRLRERQLQQAQKHAAVAQLAAGMAHEINTPSQYVSDNLSFLRDAFRDLAPLLAHFRDPATSALLAAAPQSVRDELQRLAQTVDLDFLCDEIPRAITQAHNGIERVANIVAAMRCLSDPARVDRQRVDLNRAIEDVTTIAAHEWRSDAALELALDPHIPHVPCVVSELSQALLNIVINAGQAIKQRRSAHESPLGRIVVGSRQEGDDLVVWVSDDGCGIPESIRDRIFDPFFTTKTVGVGTGQGLSFARAVVVDRHHGAFDVVSEVGAGTTVTLRIPINGQ